MAVREWYMSQALQSVSRLNAIIHELTEEEVLACLNLESGTLRRKSIIDRLISRAARLNELSYVNQLKEKYHVASTI